MSIASAKKSNRGRPTVDSEAVNVRMERPMLSALDSFATDQSDPPLSRPEAVRRALAEHFRAQGYLPTGNESEGAR